MKAKNVYYCLHTNFLTPLNLFVHQLSFHGVYNNEDGACHKGIWNIRWTFTVLIWWRQ